MNEHLDAYPELKRDLNAAATLADNCVGSSAADTGFCSGEDPRAETAAKPSAAIRITINDPVAEI